VAVHLYAGFAVTDLATAQPWYEALLGSPPSFFPNEREAVWELGEHRSLYLEQRPPHAGHTKSLLFVDDLDKVLAEIAGRGLEPAESETYDNGVRKVTFRDPDGYELGFGGFTGRS
jgi:hypothetical protein